MASLSSAETLFLEHFYVGSQLEREVQGFPRGARPPHTESSPGISSRPRSDVLVC